MTDARPQIDRLSVFARSFFKAFLIAFLPIFQIIFLRIYLHQRLQLRFGFANTTDADFLLPLPTAYFILMYLLESAEPLKFKFRPVLLVANLLQFFFFLTLNFGFEPITQHSPLVFTVLWFASLLGMVGTGFFIWVTPAYFLKNSNRFSFFPCAIIAFSIQLHMNYFNSSWNEFAPMTSHVLQFIFSWLPKSSFVASYTAEGALRIGHPYLILRIGKGCGGMESFLFFTCLFLIFFSFHRKLLTWYQWLPNYLLGIIAMFFMNVARIILLFALGIWLKSHFGNDYGADLFQAVFHTHLGWILYVMTCGVYFSLLRRYCGSVETELNHAVQTT